MCDCPEPKPCDVCGSLDKVYEYQAVHLCENCLIRSVNHEAS